MSFTELKIEVIYVCMNAGVLPVVLIPI